MTQLSTNRIQLAEHMRNTWWVTPENGTPFDALSDPKYWAHVSAKFRPRDFIEVDAEDGSYFAKFRVLDAGRLFAKVALLHKYEFGKQEVAAVSPEYEVRWAGPHAKWRIVRVADKSALKEGLENKEAADVWLLGHLKAIA